jgi:hypothetical protein
MSGFTLPTISNDYKTGQPFVGAIHPSLRQLNDYIKRKFKHDFVGVNTIALDEYIEMTNKPWSEGRYYLFGQIAVELDVPLTNELLQLAIDTNTKRRDEYGIPCNSMEAASIAHSEYVYINLLYLLQKYYQHPYDLMEFYRPDGEYMKKYIEEACCEM